MITNWDELSNNEIIEQQKRLENEFETIKTELVLELDKLEHIKQTIERKTKEGLEKLDQLDIEHDKASKILMKRKNYDRK